MIRDVHSQEHEAPCGRRTNRLARNTLSVQWLLAPAAVQRQLVTWDVEHLWVETAKDLFTFGAVWRKGHLQQQQINITSNDNDDHVNNNEHTWITWKSNRLSIQGWIRLPLLAFPTTNLSYSLPILKLPLPPCAVLPGTVSTILSNYHMKKWYVGSEGARSNAWTSRWRLIRLLPPQHGDTMKSAAKPSMGDPNAGSLICLIWISPLLYIIKCFIISMIDITYTVYSLISFNVTLVTPMFTFRVGEDYECRQSSTHALGICFWKVRLWLCDWEMPRG